MRVLLDECVPKRLGRYLMGHTARTVAQEGWAGTKNGALLALADGAGFEVFLTVDQGVRHQQNVRSLNMAVVVMVAATNDISDLLPLIPGIRTALQGIKAGDVIEVTMPAP